MLTKTGAWWNNWEDTASSTAKSLGKKDSFLRRVPGMAFKPLGMIGKPIVKGIGAVGSAIGRGAVKHPLAALALTGGTVAMAAGANKNIKKQVALSNPHNRKVGWGYHGAKFNDPRFKEQVYNKNIYY